MDRHGFEIERRFLIAMPDRAFLDGCERSEITQNYLPDSPGVSERVRSRVCADGGEYTHTVKRRISGIRREERERVIDAAEYASLLRRADPARRPIVKTRFCFVRAGLLWELDVFPFWSDRAVLEVELSDERQPAPLPENLRLLREITDDPRYRNSALAKEIPEEDETILKLLRPAAAPEERKG